MLCAVVIKTEAAVVILEALAPEVSSPSGFCAALLNFWGVGHPRLHTGLPLGSVGFYVKFSLQLLCVSYFKYVLVCAPQFLALS